MKSLILLFALYCFTLTSHTYAQSWQWARATNCSSNNAEGVMVATDLAGNVFIAGNNQSDSICFGSMAFKDGSTSIAKYDDAGNLKWAAAAIGNTWPIDIVADQSGNLYVYGFFEQDSVWFGSHVVTQSNTPSVIGYYLIKYDANGNIIWIKSVGDNWFYSGYMALDPEGNIYITGSFSDSTLTIGTHLLKKDIFIAKYNSSGNVIWAKDFGREATHGDYATSIVVTADNKLYFLGISGTDSFVIGGSVLVKGNILAELYFKRHSLVHFVYQRTGTLG